ncbi:MAG: lipid A export permease/ATP-binding protein MsbA [Motiliproteus sp.]
MSSDNTIPNKVILARLFSYVRQHWGKFSIAIGCTAVVAATEPAMAALMEPLIDGSFNSKDPQAIIWVPLALIGIFFVRGVARVLSALGITAVATQVVMQLRIDLYHHLQQLPQSFMDQQATGKLLSKVTYDVEQLSSTASQVWMILVRDTLIVIGLLGYLFYLNWRLSLVLIVLAPVIAIIIKVVSKRMRSSSKALQSDMGQLTHRLEESIKGHKLIKLYGAEQQENKKFFNVVNSLRRNNFKLKMIAAANSPIIQQVLSIALASVVYLAASMEGDASMTTGQFVSFFTAMGMLLGPMRSLTGVNEQLQRGLAAADSVFQLMDERSEQDTGTEELTRFSGHLVIKDLSFSYNEALPNALNNINLEIQPGETIAFVGASGSGKTTLTQLLPRFYEIQQGQILFDGIDSSTIKLDSLRSQIAYVDQEVLLFDESVADNVAFGGDPELDPERLQTALQHAHAQGFVEQLECGVDSKVGEQGSLLSGGQRQRLALARAFYKDAPLLILDEATSALDNESERQVQAALEELCQGRTTLVIAHRLSTIEKADRIVVMSDGEIIETGNHQQLLDHGGLYRDLYQEMH